MVKHSLECQFRMNDVKDNNENGKNDAKTDRNEQQNEEKHESGDEEWDDVTTPFDMQS